jgi:hypothetical protein
VNGPGPFKVLTRSAACIALASDVKLPAATAVSMMSLVTATEELLETELELLLEADVLSEEELAIKNPAAITATTTTPEMMILVWLFIIFINNVWGLD